MFLRCKSATRRWRSTPRNLKVLRPSGRRVCLRPMTAVSHLYPLVAIPPATTLRSPSRSWSCCWCHQWQSKGLADSNASPQIIVFSMVVVKSHHPTHRSFCCTSQSLSFPFPATTKYIYFWNTLAVVMQSNFILLMENDVNKSTLPLLKGLTPGAASLSSCVAQLARWYWIHHVGSDDLSDNDLASGKFRECVQTNKNKIDLSTSHISICVGSSCKPLAASRHTSPSSWVQSQHAARSVWKSPYLQLPLEHPSNGYKTNRNGHNVLPVPMIWPMIWHIWPKRSDSRTAVVIWQMTGRV